MGYLLPVLSNADLKLDSGMTVPTMSDWVRVGKYVRGELPQEWPEITEIKPDFEWAGLWRENELMVLDTEYIVDTRFVYQVGLCKVDTNEVFIWDRHNPTHMSHRQMGVMLRALVGQARIVSQNLQAEMLSFQSTWKIPVRKWPRVEDTMLMMAALWVELKKGLGFLASLYGQHDKVKHLGPGSYEYLRGDVVETANVYRHLRLEMMNDEGARLAYQRMLALVPILCDAKIRGIDLDTTVVDHNEQDLQRIADEQLLRCQAYAGWPINPDSGDHLSAMLGEVEDAYELAKGSGIRRKKNKNGTISFSKDKISELQEELRARDIQHPLLEAKAAYTEARHMRSLVFKPMIGRDKVYPDVALHVQASGRWSYTNPPMSLIPPQYIDMVTCPKGMTLISGDWSNIEGRLGAYHTGDQVEIDIFEQGWDGHIINACDLFGLPLPPDPANWEKDAEWCAAHNIDKEDARRKFAKGFRYSLSYGKKIENLPTIPGAKKLGLKDAELIAGGHRWLSKRPGLKAYWDGIEHESRVNAIVRDFYGRPRRLLNDDFKARFREAINHPLQGTVAGFLAETVVMLDEQLPEGSFMVMTTHDSIKWAVPDEHADEAAALMQRICERKALPDGKGGFISVPFEVERKKGKA